MSLKQLAACLFAFVVFTSVAGAQNTPPKWVTDGPSLAAGPASFEVPLKVVATKLYVMVEIGGKPRRFVVDTGSPSMINAALAKELGLEVVGKSKGRDAHGVIIESDIVQATINLGGVTFHKVPMFAADFSASAATKFFIGDGVLGSELLPLGAWQMDLQSSVLRFHTEVKKLPLVDRAVKVRLYDFGYPHAPILDVQFAKQARSKAMLDTGSPSYFAISPPDLGGAKSAGGIGRSIAGYGTPGGSLGGQAPSSDQLQVELKALSIDKLKLGPVAAIRRDSSPSLIGAELLRHFVVTFDSKAGAAYFAQYAEGPFAQPTFGFTLAFDDGISVGVVWEHTPAYQAGIRSGMPLSSINGVPTELSGQGIYRAITAMAGEQIDLLWEGGSARLTRKSQILED